MAIGIKRNVREELEQVIRACADEIVTHGVDALYDENEICTGGQIVIDIDAEMMPEIRFIRRVLTQIKICKEEAKNRDTE